MLIQRILKLLPLSLVAVGAMAQSGEIRGPVSGLVYDGAEQAIRPILGIPGASYLGSPLVSRLDFARVSPDGEAAIAASEGRLYLLNGLSTGSPEWTILEGSGTADRVAWSADSDSAAVYSAASGRLRLWTGLAAASGASDVRPSPRGLTRRARPGGDGPRLTDLGSAPGSRVSALSIDERGDVIVGIEDEGAGGVYLASPGRKAALIAPASRPSAIATAGDRLFVADRSTNEILEIGAYRDAADVQLFAGADRGIADPVALGLSADGRSLIAASGADRRLVFFDISSRAETARIDLDFEPSRLDARNDASLFLLNARGARGETLQALAGGRAPAVYFIPAARAAASTPEE